MMNDLRTRQVLAEEADCQGRMVPALRAREWSVVSVLMMRRKKLPVGCFDSRDLNQRVPSLAE